MIARILIPIFAMAGLGLVFGLGLAYTLKLFGIEIDPTVALIITKLPGANCGVCGKAGCAGFAEALAKGETIPSSCVVSNEEARKAITEILGVEYNPKVKTIATLVCNGGKYNAKDKYLYKGIKSCKAASRIFQGPKACKYACVGLGDCAKECPFDAIVMDEDDLPRIDPKKCTACGVCVKTCPKNVLTLYPISKKYYIKCNSNDKGAKVMRVCKVGCIACGKCVKACPYKAITMEDNLAKIDYNICDNAGECFKVCPTHAISQRKQ